MKSNQIVKFIHLLQVFISIQLLIKVSWGASILGSVYLFINQQGESKRAKLFYENIVYCIFFFTWARVIQLVSDATKYEKKTGHVRTRLSVTKNVECKMIGILNLQSQSYQPFFFVKQRFFPFFYFKLGHLKEQTIFYHASNTQAYQ